MKMKLKTVVLLVPVFLLSLATAQAGEAPVLAAPEVAGVALVAEPGCGDVAALEVVNLEEMLQPFTPAVLPAEPILKAGCFGSYGSCECFKLPGQSGCLTSGGGSDCSRCCANLHC